MTDERLREGSWDFADMGAEFDQHVAAHLPGYADVQRLVSMVASYVLPPDGAVVADLGSSTGRTAELIWLSLSQRSIDFHLYDADGSMLIQSEATRKLPRSTNYHNVRLPQSKMLHSGAHLTVALWLLQFIRPDDRREVLQKALDAAAPSGVILIATKTQHHDSRWQEISVGALDDYKRDRGVSADDRAAKTAALRGTMQPPTVQECFDDLEAAGWHSPALLWRWHVWSVIGAWATPRTDRW